MKQEEQASGNVQRTHTLFLLLKARARTLQLSGFVSSLGMSFKALWVMWAYTGTCDTLCLASLLVNTSSVTSQSPIEPSREPAGRRDHRRQTYPALHGTVPQQSRWAFLLSLFVHNPQKCWSSVGGPPTNIENFNSHTKRMIQLRCMS